MGRQIVFLGGRNCKEMKRMRELNPEVWLLMDASTFSNAKETRDAESDIPAPPGNANSPLVEVVEAVVVPKAWTMCAQNSTAIPRAMARLTRETALSWMPVGGSGWFRGQTGVHDD